MPDRPDPNTLQDAPPAGDTDIDALRPWFHNLHLPDGRQTSPNHRLGDFPRFKWDQIAPHLPADLEGWTALDIGCNAGFYTIELARRGARVTAMDVDPHYLRQAEWAVGQHDLQSRVTIRRGSVYDLLHAQESFDLVWFMGVLYHLRYPMLALDLVGRAARRLAVVQTLTLPGDPAGLVHNGTAAAWDVDYEDRDRLTGRDWPSMAFVPHRFAGDPTNWWVPSKPGIEAMLRSAGLNPLHRCEEETWLCEPSPSHARQLDALPLSGDGADHATPPGKENSPNA